MVFSGVVGICHQDRLASPYLGFWFCDLTGFNDLRPGGKPESAGVARLIPRGAVSRLRA
jgi:hypothetical protein